MAPLGAPALNSAAHASNGNITSSRSSFCGRVTSDVGKGTKGVRVRSVNHVNSHLEEELGEIQELLRHDSHSSRGHVAAHGSHHTPLHGSHHAAQQQHHHHHAQHRSTLVLHSRRPSDEDEDEDSDDADAILEEHSHSRAAAAHAVCSLGIRTDPVDVMRALRKALAEFGKCVLTIAEGRPGLLLDAVGMLHLLNQDLRLEEDFVTSIFFQPVPSDPVQGVPRGGLALLVSRCKAPELLRQRPSCIIDGAAAISALPQAASAATTSSGGSPTSPSSSNEAWDMARLLAQKLDGHALIQLRSASPRSLVTVLKALKRARKLLTMGGLDLLVTPHIVTEHGRPTICFNCWRTRAARPLSSNGNNNHSH